ncbi:MAG: hypothetical protein ACFE8U_03085 [Candidatus Hermodarchaeota archaeon]
MVYTTEEVETSYKALIQLGECYNKDKSLQGRFVLTGGWAPYFITLNRFQHTGSRDIDLVLSLELMKIYTNIVRLMTENLGYRQTGPFEFLRTDNDITYEVHFLCEPKHVPPNIGTYRIQRGLYPFVIRGSSIVFDNNFFQQIGDTKILVSGPVASISLKAHAFDIDANRIKDPYDIYAILISVDNIDQLLSSWASSNPFVEESLELLRRTFESETSRGPAGAAEYLIANPSERVEFAARVYTSVNSILDKIP